MTYPLPVKATKESALSRLYELSQSGVLTFLAPKNVYRYCLLTDGVSIREFAVHLENLVDQHDSTIRRRAFETLYIMIQHV